MDSGMVESGVYLYCFARRAFVAEAIEAPSVNGQGRVTSLQLGELVAVTSDVELVEFTGPQAEAHLSDLSWVGPRAVRHEQVIEEIQRRSPVFPVRFGSLFSSRDILLEAMRQHHDDILAFLDRTDGQEEWAVKGYLDRSSATEAVTREAMAAEEDQRALSPGKRFLERQRLSSQAGRRLSDWVQAAREQLRRRLQEIATSLVERPAGAGVAAEHPGELVLNTAVLVARHRVSSLLSAVEALNAEWGARGLTLQCTGPLPPYSFTPALDRRK